jgi:hypothetical protein
MGNSDESDETRADIVCKIMDSDFSVVPKQYDRACHLSLPGGIGADGHEAADAFWLGMRSAFLSAVLEIAHQIGGIGQLMSPRSESVVFDGKAQRMVALWSHHRSGGACDGCQPRRVWTTGTTPRNYIFR